MRALEVDPVSLTARSLGADGWSRLEHLLALAVDELRLANWQRTKDGAKNRNRPTPISPLKQQPGQRIGKTDRSPAEVAAYLQRLHTRAEHEEEVGIRG